MKYELSKTVFCPLLNCEETVYLHLLGNAVIPSICENGNGSKECDNCIIQAVKGVTNADFDNSGVIFPC